MTRGEQIIVKIKNVFTEIRKRYPLITDDDLHENGAIFYMNGNDGTDFDWSLNDRTSEFYMCHSNEIGFIKLYVNKDDTYTAYVFPNGEMSAVETIRGNLDEESLYLATLLYYKADREYIYDANIEEIDFSYEPKDWEMHTMSGEYETNDDYWHEEDEE